LVPGKPTPMIDKTARARREDVSIELRCALIRSTMRRHTVPLVSEEQRSRVKYALEHAQGADGLLFLPWQNVRRDLVQECDRAGMSPAAQTTFDAPAPPGCARRAPLLT